MLMERVGMEDGEPIEHRYTTRAIENAQKKVEGHNFDIRKHLLEFDDVMNRQREVIYSQRRFILGGNDLKQSVQDKIEDVAEEIVGRFTDERSHYEDWGHRCHGRGSMGSIRAEVNFDSLDPKEQTVDGIAEYVRAGALEGIRE